MIFVPVPNTAKIELVYSIDGQTLENVMHFVGANPPTETDLTNLAADARLMWHGTFRNIQALGCQLVKIKATDCSSEDGAAIEYTTLLPDTGTISEEMMSNNVTACVSLKTAKRGRSYRGRIYVPGLPISAVSTNTLTTTVVNYLNSYFSEWNWLDNDGEPWGLVVASRYHNNQPRVIGVTTPVTSFITNSTVASQRRRLPGRGR
jgi:hypothetical protein